MTKGAKIAVGCLIALVVACIIAGVVGFVLYKKGVGIFGGAFTMGKNIQAIQKLDETIPFTQPEDGIVPEPRLQAFIRVCGKVKPGMDSFKALVDANKDKEKGSMKDVKEVMDVLAKITGAMKEGLEQEKMPPKEFRFITDAMKQAKEASAGPETPPLTPDQRKGKENLIQSLEKTLEDPNLPENSRNEIEAQINELKAQLSAEPTPGSSPNGALYQKYAGELKTVDLHGMEDMAFTGKVDVK